MKVFIWTPCLNSGCLKNYLFLLVFSLYYQGIYQYNPLLFFFFKVNCIPFDLEYFMLIFLLRIYIVLIFSSLVSDHTVLSNLLQCDPTPKIFYNSSSCIGGLWGRGYIYSLSCDSTPSPHDILCLCSPAPTHVPHALYTLFMKSHEGSLTCSWLMEPSEKTLRSMRGTGGDASSSILARC